MATTHWRKGYSVEALYTQPDAGWSFHQLVHLLLGMQVPEAELLDTLTQKIRFTSSKSPSLPAGEVRQVSLPSAYPKALSLSLEKESLEKKSLKAKSSEEKRSEKQSRSQAAMMECTHYNLTGLDGPLAEPFLDMMNKDLRMGKGAMAAFIDLFNNRIHALRYLIHAQTNTTYANSEASESQMGQFLLALSGHYYPVQRRLRGMDDDGLLSLAGHLGNCRMTLPTIRKLFSTLLDLPVITMNSLIGRWLAVDKQDHCRLGVQNQRLGSHAVLGKKVWDQQAAIELELGPIALSRASELVPGGSRHHKLRDLLAWVTEKRVDCWVSFVCFSEPEPETETELGQNKNATRLSTRLKIMHNSTNRLGYGAALNSRKREEKRIRFLLRLVT